MWRSPVVILGIAMLCWTAGCENKCSSACNKIYEECKSAVPDLDKQACETTCQENEKKDPKATAEEIDCVMNVSCSKVEACFSEAGGAGCGSSCSKIYDECALTIAGLEKNTDCEDQCIEEGKDDPEGTKEIIDCVTKTACSNLETCFSE